MVLALDTAVSDEPEPRHAHDDDVVHLIHSGGFYGAERMLLDHCRYAPGRHRVIFLDTPDSLPQRFRAAGVACTGARGLSGVFAALAAAARQSPALVMNAHNFRAQIFAWCCASRLQLPLALTQHGFTPRSAKQRLYTRIALRLGRSRRVRRIACVAQSIVELHRQAGVPPEKLDFIPNGLPPKPVLPRQADRPLIGFVGRLSAEKGPDLFLDAVIPLCARHPEWQAVLLGDGQEAARLQARINAAGMGERIRLHGYQQDMDAWFARLSLLALTSRTEGTPMVLLEAMRAGTPIVAFAVGGVPDMLAVPVSGLLAPPGDVSALAAQIERLLADDGLAESLGAAARARQQRDYDLTRQSERWRQFYAATKKVAPC
ncbi:MAG: glycosyltransferase family 4 protein [Zoogloeaceae bacterium]|jgi:glycosyltransferase involved in cell wall biosynthesis|nr:glycosyltransferase family 4 protein [Zoogloeaceae bacterium]